MTEKRDATVRAARRIFGRDGYARASIDAIAIEAGVSTRTLYKHFSSKESLFAFVLETSATEVADGTVERIRSAPVAESAGDVAAELETIAHALVRQAIDYRDHFAMVRQINAESTHFPAAMLRTWQKAGPLRVESAVAERLAGLAERGLIVVPDLERATLHFVTLTTAEANPRGLHQAGHLTAAETDVAVAAGVRTFLFGYSV
ncbi:TetR/AcrR family transcriptional regulator [Cryptosporangium phraense]|uniref:TetR/AcrR family transcriptional regulator n=1 Tax=Cryptosporangium phraense TaxID=2593070 RepID=A0A545AHN4_9ACTN|nr:TetR/AcrR family transcriptional regulator [Cryptosporangium phraense]TQS40834.1 TetR/AcrR family transcriptional regulator [Cryptosporangium phraense]